MEGGQFGKEREIRFGYRRGNLRRTLRQRGRYRGDLRGSLGREGFPRSRRRVPTQRRRRGLGWRTRIPGRVKEEARRVQVRTRSLSLRRGWRRRKREGSPLEVDLGERRRLSLWVGRRARLPLPRSPSQAIPETHPRKRLWWRARLGGRRRDPWGGEGGGTWPGSGREREEREVGFTEERTRTLVEGGSRRLWGRARGRRGERRRRGRTRRQGRKKSKDG
jgi:hypothetical protein